MVPVPDSLILTFFQHTCENLNKCTTREFIAKLNSVDSMNLLDASRKHVWQVQERTLQETVRKYNEEKGDGAISLDGVTAELERLGKLAKLEKASGKEKSATAGPSIDPKIMNAIKEMNDAERTAYSRCVLASSWSYLDDFTTTDDGVGSAVDDSVMLGRQNIFDYFSLCCSVVKLKEAKRFLKGECMRILYYVEDDESVDQDAEGEAEDPTKNLTHTEQRLIFLEQVLLRGVLGYPVSDPTIVVTEAKRLLNIANKDTKGGDPKLQQAFDDFILAMRLAYCEVWEPARE